MILLFSIANEKIAIKEESKKLFLASKESKFVFVPIEDIFKSREERAMMEIINMKIRGLNKEETKDYIIKEMQGIGLTFLTEKESL